MKTIHGLDGGREATLWLMIVEYIRYRIEDGDAFLAAYEQACESLRIAPECLGYELTRCSEQASDFTLRIRWTSAAGHLEGFRKGPHFPGFLAAIRRFVPAILEMRHYELTPLHWERG